MKKLNYLLLSAALVSSCAFMPAHAAVSGPKAAMNQNVDNMIDINRADAKALTALPGVGVKKAEEIIKYRELNGDFNSVDELVNVKGIGVKMVAKFVDLVKV